MSSNTIATAAVDVELQERIQAIAHKEVISNATLKETDFGKSLMGEGGSAFPNWTMLYWNVAVATEAAYETALLAGRGCPGHDTDIITDAALTSAVVANWPPDFEPPEVTP